MANRAWQPRQRQRRTKVGFLKTISTLRFFYSLLLLHHSNELSLTLQRRKGGKVKIKSWQTLSGNAFLLFPQCTFFGRRDFCAASTINHTPREAVAGLLLADHTTYFCLSSCINAMLSCEYDTTQPPYLTAPRATHTYSTAVVLVLLWLQRLLQTP